MTLLLVNARLGEVDTCVRIDGHRITEIGPGLRPSRGDDVLDGRGGWLSPGLHDHHVHLLALAAAEGSIQVGPPVVNDRAQLERATRRAVTSAPSSWVRGVGYHESVAGDLTAAMLDEWAPTTPVRIQHRSGAMWILNSEALRRTGLTDVADGRLLRGDDRIAAVAPDVPLDLAAVGRRAAGWGVTGFTDADPVRSPEQVDLLRLGVRQRLHLMGQPDLMLEADERVTLGPVKVLLDDDRLPTIDELTDLVTDAHQRGRAVAVHCVTRVQLVVALAAFARAGTGIGDRVEHGSLIPIELVPEIGRLGLAVCTQPNFVAERGDAYLADLDADDRRDLYRCGSLIDGGVTVALGTDAPFGAPNPWALIAAARDRTTRTGHAIGPAERIDAHDALRRFTLDPIDLALPRGLAVGQPADLAVLPAPLDDLVATPDEARTTWTIAGGTVIGGEDFTHD